MPRHISLGYIEVTDFKSFRGTHEITLSTGPGLKYITGTNEANPRLGSNGAGKTSIWDAVVWCLTGYSIRGRRAADLASWGTKSCRVLLGLIIDDTFCTIERTGSPNRLLIDDDPAEQDEVDRLLLSRRRLLHSVIFGQSVGFFYNLSVPERGVILDEVMNLGLWLKLAEKANTKATDVGKELQRLENAIKYNQGLLDGSTTQETELADLDKEWQETWKSQIDADLHALQQWEEAYEAAQQELNLVQQQISKLPNMQTLHTKVQEAINHAQKVLTDIALAQEGDAQSMAQLIFFQNHSTCPQCQQRITDDFRQHKITAIEATVGDIEKYRLALADAEDKALTASASAQQAYQHATEQAIQLGHEETALKQSLRRQQEDIARYSTEIQSNINNPNNPYTQSLLQLRNKIAGHQAEIAKLNMEYKVAQGEQIKYEYWRTGFRRVRLFQVKQVLTRLEIETANAASALGIGEWLIKYSTEVETKSGTMKPGIHITVMAPDGDKVAEESGGEEQRVRLAVSKGFSSLIQDMAGIKFDFEVWDEPSAWLSAEGIDDLLGQLREHADSTGRSIWLLDHRVADQTIFDEVLHVVKTQEGSSVK